MRLREHLMSEAEFWQILEEARQNCRSGEEMAGKIKEKLRSMSLARVLGFDYWFTKFYYNSYSAELWCAAYIAKGECNEDDFDYFRAWLIGQGREVYTNAVKNPDTLVEVLENLPEGEQPMNEALLIAAKEAYKEQTGKDDFYDLLDDYITDFGSFDELEFTWQEEDAVSLRNVCPRIFDRFWGRPV